MNRAQFCKKLKALNDKHKLAKEKLATACAKSNSIIDLGDIIDSGSEQLEVETILVNWISANVIPTCIYTGPKLTAAGEKWASGKYIRIHESNVCKINGEIYKGKL